MGARGSGPAVPDSGACAELYFARFGEQDRDAWVRAAEQWLAAPELERAAAVADPEARAQHVVGRAILRIIAGKAGGQPPDAVAVAVTKTGKPYLAELPGVHVSVAHTRGLVAVATLRGASLGVDVEAPRAAGRNPRAIAARRFADPERSRFAGIAEERVVTEFLRYWTAKEAVGKALGIGVMPALRGAVLGVSDQDRLELRAVLAGPPARDWTLHQLRLPGGDELAAVAIAAPATRLAAARRFELRALRSGLPE